MNDQFVTYEIAKKFKELGFNEECFGYHFRKGSLRISTYEMHEDITPCPLWQQAIDWLREKHDIHLEITFGVRGTAGFASWGCAIYKASIGLQYYINDPNTENPISLSDFSYNQAREASVLKALELLSIES